MQYALFKPLYSLVPQCDFIMFTQPMHVEPAHVVLPPPLSFTTLWFVWLLSFRNHLWYVHCAKHKYHGWYPQNICTARKLSPRVIKRGVGGSYAQVYVPMVGFRQFVKGNSCFQFSMYKIDFFQRIGCSFKLTYIFNSIQFNSVYIPCNYEG